MQQRTMLSYGRVILLFHPITAPSRVLSITHYPRIKPTSPSIYIQDAGITQPWVFTARRQGARKKVEVYEPGMRGPSSSVARQRRARVLKDGPNERGVLWSIAGVICTAKATASAPVMASCPAAAAAGVLVPPGRHHGTARARRPSQPNAPIRCRDVLAAYARGVCHARCTKRKQAAHAATNTRLSPPMAPRRRDSTRRATVCCCPQLCASRMVVSTLSRAATSTRKEPCDALHNVSTRRTLLPRAPLRYAATSRTGTSLSPSASTTAVGAGRSSAQRMFANLPGGARRCV